MAWSMVAMGMQEEEAEGVAVVVDGLGILTEREEEEEGVPTTLPCSNNTGVRGGRAAIIAGEEEATPHDVAVGAVVWKSTPPPLPPFPKEQGVRLPWWAPLSSAVMARGKVVRVRGEVEDWITGRVSAAPNETAMAWEWEEGGGPSVRMAIPILRGRMGAQDR